MPGDKKVAHVIDERCGSQRLITKGVANHVLAQASSLREWVVAGPIDHMIVFVRFDDASMWVRRAMQQQNDEQKEAARLFRKRQLELIEAAVAQQPGMPPFKRVKQLQDKASSGRNVHMPHLNMIEMVVARRAKVSTAAEVQSPPQGLAEANYATDMRNFRRWAAFVLRSAGRGVDPEGILDDTVVAAPRKRTVVLQNDALTLNDTLLAQSKKQRVLWAPYQC